MQKICEVKWHGSIICKLEPCTDTSLKSCLFFQAMRKIAITDYINTLISSVNIHNREVNHNSKVMKYVFAGFSATIIDDSGVIGAEEVSNLFFISDFVP